MSTGPSEPLERRMLLHVAPVSIPNPDSYPFHVSQLTPALQLAYQHFVEVVDEAGGTVTPTSGYRPLSYQQHFRDIFDTYNALVGGKYAVLSGGRLKATATADAQDKTTIAQINSEIGTHGLGFPPRVNQPTRSAHTSNPSAAFDARVDGVSDIDRLAAYAGLYRPYLSNGTREGQIHFEILPSATDLVFVIDTTGSMGDDIDAVKAEATNLVTGMFAGTTNATRPRVGIVLYKDYGDEYQATTLLGFSDNVEEIVSALNTIEVGGGGDTPESVYSGLMQAIETRGDLKWWRGGNVSKQIILFGDAGPHDPEPGTGYTAESVAEAALNVDPANVFAIATGDTAGSVDAFGSIAAANRGRFFDASSGQDIAQVVAGAIAVAAPTPPAPVSRVIAVGQGAGGTGKAGAITPLGDSITVLPFKGYKGAVVSRSGDVNGDGIADLAVATAGAGVSSVVKVYDGVDGHLVGQVRPFGKKFTGGVSLAVADVNGDGHGDLVVGSLTGRDVAVFSGAAADFPLIGTFKAFGPKSKGGVTVAAGDLDDDGHAEVIVASGAAPAVRVYAGNGLTQTAAFTAFPLSSKGAVSLAVGDLDGDGRPEIIVGSGSAPAVRRFDATGKQVGGNLAAYPASVHVGVTVSVADWNGDGVADLVVTTDDKKNTRVRVLDARTGKRVDDFALPSDTYKGGGVSVG